MIPLAFHGGTALRFLYSLPRHSEDLDFALEGNPAAYDFERYVGAIEAEFYREGYDLELKTAQERIVHNAWIRFRGLLYEMGLSNQHSEVFSLKLEVDTNPPAGADLATTVVRRYVILQVQHHDPASLLAGKIHAVLQRPFTKGRDLYDLLWYLSDPEWPDPNLILLSNALKQTEWTCPALTDQNWKAVLRECLEGVAWDSVREDVAPFLERADEIELLTRENIFSLLA